MPSMPRRAPDPVTEPREGGLRERKKELVREQLVEAATRLFARKGFDATTIDDIVDAAQVSRRTFFRYFDTKEDVLPAWFDRYTDGVVGTVDERPEDEDALTVLRHVLERVAAIYESELATVLTIERVIGREPSIVARRYKRVEDLADALSKRLVARRGGRKADEAHYRMLARVAMAIALSALERWVVGGGKGSLVAVMRDAFGAVQAAFAEATAAPRKRRS
jgi:AcrR family transcriptional regulator